MERISPTARRQVLSLTDVAASRIRHLQQQRQRSLVATACRKPKIMQLRSSVKVGVSISEELPQTFRGGSELVPTAILDKRMRKRKGKTCTQLLIQWNNAAPEEATWE